MGKIYTPLNRPHTHTGGRYWTYTATEEPGIHTHKHTTCMHTHSHTHTGGRLWKCTATEHWGLYSHKHAPTHTCMYIHFHKHRKEWILKLYNSQVCRRTRFVLTHSCTITNTQIQNLHNYAHRNTFLFSPSEVFLKKQCQHVRYSVCVDIYICVHYRRWLLMSLHQ